VARELRHSSLGLLAVLEGRIPRLRDPARFISFHST